MTGKMASAKSPCNQRSLYDSPPAQRPDGTFFYRKYCIATYPPVYEPNRAPFGRHVPVHEMKIDTATVLCIDDESTALQLRQTVLESAGYKVLAAKSGAQGIKLFGSEPVHAVILDYWMADMK